MRETAEASENKLKRRCDLNPIEAPALNLFREVDKSFDRFNI